MDQGTIEASDSARDVFWGSGDLREREGDRLRESSRREGGRPPSLSSPDEMVCGEILRLAFLALSRDLKLSREILLLLARASVFRICDANVQGLDVQEAHIRARSKSERAPMKTFMYVQNLELRACTPLVPGIFWPRKIQNFGAPGMNPGVRPKHERIRTNTFTYVQLLDVHGKY